MRIYISSISIGRNIRESFNQLDNTRDLSFHFNGVEENKQTKLANQFDKKTQNGFCHCYVQNVT